MPGNMQDRGEQDSAPPVHAPLVMGNKAVLMNLLKFQTAPAPWSWSRDRRGCIKPRVLTVQQRGPILTKM